MWASILLIEGGQWRGRRAWAVQTARALDD